MLGRSSGSKVPRSAGPEVVLLRSVHILGLLIRWFNKNKLGGGWGSPSPGPLLVDSERSESLNPRGSMIQTFWSL